MPCNYTRYFLCMENGNYVDALRYACSETEADLAFLLGTIVYGRKYDVDSIKKLLEAYREKMSELGIDYKSKDIYDRVVGVLEDLVYILENRDKITKEFLDEVSEKLTELSRKALEKAIENPDKYADFLRAIGYDPELVKQAKIEKESGIREIANEIYDMVSELSEYESLDVDTVYEKGKVLLEKMHEFYDKLMSLRGKLDEKYIKQYANWFRKVLEGVGDTLFYAFIAKKDFDRAKELVSLASVVGAENAARLEKLLIIYRKIDNKEIPPDIVIAIGKYLSGENVSLPAEYKVLADAIKEMPEEDRKHVIRALLYLGYEEVKDDPKKVIELAKAYMKFEPLIATYFKKQATVIRDFNLVYDRARRWLKLFVEHITSGDIKGAENIYKYIDGQILKFYNEYRRLITKPLLEETDYYKVLEFLRKFMKAELDFAKKYTDYYERLKKLSREAVIDCEPSDYGCLANKYGQLKALYRKLAFEGVDFSKVYEEISELKKLVASVSDSKMRDVLAEMLDSFEKSVKNVEKSITHGRRVFQALSEVFAVVSELYLWLWNFLNTVEKIPRETYAGVRSEFKTYLEKFLKALRILKSMRYPEDYRIKAGEQEISINELIKKTAEMFEKAINDMVNMALQIGDERMYHDLEEIRDKYDVLKLPEPDEYQKIMKHAYPAQEVIANIIDYSKVFANRVFDELFKKKNPVVVPLLGIVAGALLGRAIIDIMTTIIRPMEAERQLFFILDGARTLLTNPVGWANGAASIIAGMFSSPEAAAESLSYIIAGFLLGKLIADLPTTRRVIASVLTNVMQADPVGLAGDILEITGIRKAAVGFVKKLRGEEKILLGTLPGEGAEITYKNPYLVKALKELGYEDVREEVLRRVLIRNAKRVAEYLVSRYKTLKNVDLSKVEKQVFEALVNDPKLLQEIIKTKGAIEDTLSKLVHLVVKDGKIDVKIKSIGDLTTKMLNVEKDFKYIDKIYDTVSSLSINMKRYANLLRKAGLDEAASVFDDYARKFAKTANALKSITELENVVDRLRRVLESEPTVSRYVEAVEKEVVKDLDNVIKKLEQFGDVEEIRALRDKLIEIKDVLEKDPVRGLAMLSKTLGDLDEALDTLVSKTEPVKELENALSRIREYVDKIVVSKVLTPEANMKLVNLLYTLEELRKDVEKLAVKDPKYATLMTAINNAIDYIKKTREKAVRQYIIRVTGELDDLRNYLYRLSEKYPQTKWLLGYVDKIEELVKAGKTDELYKVLIDIRSNLDKLIPLTEKAKDMLKRVLERIALVDPKLKKYATELLYELNEIISPPDNLKAVFGVWYEGKARYVPVIFAEPGMYEKLRSMFTKTEVYDISMHGRKLTIIRKPYSRTGEAGIIYLVYDPERNAYIEIKYYTRVEGNPIALYLRKRFGKDVKIIQGKIIKYDPTEAASVSLYRELSEFIENESPAIFKDLDIFKKYAYVPTPEGMATIAEAIAKGVIKVLPPTLAVSKPAARVWNYDVLSKAFSEFFKKYGRVDVVVNVGGKTIPITFTNLKDLVSFLENIEDYAVSLMLYTAGLQLPKSLEEQLAKQGVITIPTPPPVPSPTPPPTLAPGGKVPTVYIPLVGITLGQLEKIVGKGLAKEKIALY